MVVHDSMMIAETRAMVSMAKQEYLPDFKIGLQYMTEPMGQFKGWTVTAGVMLPFAPWTLGKASARVEEAEAALEKTQADFEATRSMVAATVRDDYFRAMSAKTQLDNFTNLIVPKTQQALQASLAAYQTGKTDFLMLLDSYRMLVELSMEKLMLRMQYEQAVASLRRHVGAWPGGDLTVKGN
jgi:outer membrane protein TolC